MVLLAIVDFVAGSVKSSPEGSARALLTVIVYLAHCARGGSKA